MSTVVYLLTGDVGGTNSRMSLYKLKEETPVVVKTYRNATSIPKDKLGHPNVFIDYIVQPFLDFCWNEQTDCRLIDDPSYVTIVACIASAGVVANNQVRLTNLGNMLICGNSIQNNTSSPLMKCIVRCMIINDFVAQGYGCLTLKKSEVQHMHGPDTVFSTSSSSNLNQLAGPKVCVGAGTGLGECYLTQSVHAEPGDDPYSCFPSEGGHVEYAPRNDLEVELFQYLTKKLQSHHRISVERVVSGKGLANVYGFLAQKFPKKIVKSVHDEFLQAGDQQGRVVATNATPGSLCLQAMEIFASAYGCEVGSAAIKWIPAGGLFVTGGLTPKNMKFIHGKDTEFMKSYLHKGRVSPILERVPLYAVLTEDLGVRGARKAALMAYEIYSHSAPSKDPTFSSFWSSPTFTNILTAVAAAVGSSLAVALVNRKK